MQTHVSCLYDATAATYIGALPYTCLCPCISACLDTCLYTHCTSRRACLYTCLYTGPYAQDVDKHSATEARLNPPNMMNGAAICLTPILPDTVEASLHAAPVFTFSRTMSKYEHCLRNLRMDRLTVSASSASAAVCMRACGRAGVRVGVQACTFVIFATTCMSTCTTTGSTHQKVHVGLY